MKEFTNIDINTMTQKEKDEFLFGLIPHLKHFKSEKGAEGTVYFIDDKFIVKEYLSPAVIGTVAEVDFNKVFDLYCEEIKGFSDKGYSVPKIYSWTKIQPKNKIFSKDVYPRCYILEERINGRALYLPKLSSCDELFKDLVSKNKFYNIMDNPNSNTVIYKEMVKRYISDYILANEYIISMSDNDLDAFISSIGNMFEEAEYGLPDVHASNVLMVDNKLILIDNYMAVKKDNVLFDEQTVEDFLIARLSILFGANERVLKLGAKDNLSNDLEIKKLIEQNSLFCYDALEKILKSMKRCLNGKMVESHRALHTAYQRMSKILGFNNAINLIKIVNERYF